MGGERGLVSKQRHFAELKLFREMIFLSFNLFLEDFRRVQEWKRVVAVRHHIAGVTIVDTLWKENQGYIERILQLILQPNVWEL